MAEIAPALADLYAVAVSLVMGDAWTSSRRLHDQLGAAVPRQAPGFALVAAFLDRMREEGIIGLRQATGIYPVLRRLS